MNILKSAALIAVISVTAGPTLAETVMNDAKSRLYEADYAAVLAENDIATGVAVYGKYDADYDAYLSAPDVFKPWAATRHADAADLDRTVIASR